MQDQLNENITNCLKGTVLKLNKYICQERFLIKIKLFNVSLKAKICLDDIFLGMDIKRIRERQKGARVLRSLKQCTGMFLVVNI